MGIWDLWQENLLYSSLDRNKLQQNITKSIVIKKPLLFQAFHSFHSLPPTEWHRLNPGQGGKDGAGELPGCVGSPPSLGSCGNHCSLLQGADLNGATVHQEVKRVNSFYEAGLTWVSVIIDLELGTTWGGPIKARSHYISWAQVVPRLCACLLYTSPSPRD